MEIYKDLSNQNAKEFEKLLNSQLSKTKIEEGKVIDGEVTKITNKFVFLFVEGLKSEPIIDINELKSLNILEKVKEGSKIPVLLERIEDKNGDVVVSATKAQKIKGWFENGSIDCLLVSDKGIEGIDYKSCSSSFMICIDPVKSAGKQDQFNGRTVRRNSHKNLPNSMRTVEYVSFVGTGLNRNQDTSEEDKKVEALRKRELIQYIDKNPNNSVASKVRVNELVRREKADKELKTLDEQENDWLVRARKHVRKEIYSKTVTIKDEEGEEEMEVQEYVDDAKRKFDALKINYMDYKSIDTRTKQLLSADNELGLYIPDKQYDVDEQFTEKSRIEIREDAIKLWILPNSIGSMDDGEKEEMLYRQKLKYNQLRTNDEKRNLLQYEYKVDDFIVDPGINQLEISLGLRPSKFRPTFNLNIKRRRKVDVDIEDAKKWSTYFDNYVNLSHVPVFNNYAFTCLHDVNTTNKDHFCYACNKNRRMMNDMCEKCGLPLKVNGKYLYYHLVKTTEKPTEKTKDDLKEMLGAWGAIIQNHFCGFNHS